MEMILLPAQNLFDLNWVKILKKYESICTKGDDRTKQRVTCCMCMLSETSKNTLRPDNLVQVSLKD